MHAAQTFLRSTILIGSSMPLKSLGDRESIA
jgi:hypothetical protein